MKTPRTHSLMTLIFLMSVALFTHAQNENQCDHAADGKGASGHHAMFKAMKLDKSQKKAVKKLMHAELEKRHQILQTYLEKLPASERSAMDIALKESRDKTHQEIEAKLSPEQQVIFKEKIKTMHDKDPIFSN